MDTQHPLGQTLCRCSHLIKARLEARLTAYDITPAQIHLLLYLDRLGGEAAQSDVISFLMVKPSTANGILARMEEKGLIRRSTSSTDGRQKLVSLTEKGAAGRQLFREEFRSFEQTLIRGLSDQELEAFRLILEHLIANLEEDEAL